MEKKRNGKEDAPDPGISFSKPQIGRKVKEIGGGPRYLTLTCQSDQMLRKTALKKGGRRDGGGRTNCQTCNRGGTLLTEKLLSKRRYNPGRTRGWLEKGRNLRAE